jgi:hypothetical protein
VFVIADVRFTWRGGKPLPTPMHIGSRRVDAAINPRLANLPTCRAPALLRLRRRYEPGGHARYSI